MEIRTLDDAALADDATMRERWELGRRSQLLGRESMPFWSFEEYAGAMRTPDSGERQVLLSAYDGDRPVGTVALWLPLLDNTEKAWFDLDVDPGARRRGVGTALAAHVAEIAVAGSRTTLLSASHLPFEGGEEHGHVRFARACGYEVSNREVVRHLDLPVPDGRLQEWADRAAERHQGYRIETFVGAVPAELVDSLCVLLGQLAVDAPSGAVDFEEETVTPERYADLIATTTAMGRARYETVALAPDGTVAAQSTLAVPLGEGTEIYQWGTFVHREHRGHRLGLATKAANLRAAQAARPDATLVTTQNAETNDYMVSINALMGFEPVEVSAEFVRRL